jgi:hypothetical protein
MMRIALVGFSWLMLSAVHAAAVEAPWQRALVGLAAWTEQGFSYQDPRLGAATAHVRGHLPEALGFWRGTTGRVYYRQAIGRVIVGSVGEGDRDLVLAALAEAPFLLTAVIDHQWTEAAHGVIRSKLAEQGAAKPPAGEAFRPDDLEAWAAALAGIATREDLPVLLPAINQLRTGSTQAKLIDQLRPCPGFDADAAIRGAWGVRYPSEYGDRQHGLVLMAAKVGIREAFVASGEVLALTSIPAPAKAELRTWLDTQPACARVERTSVWFADHAQQFSFRRGAWYLDPPKVAAVPQAGSLVRAPQPIPDPPLPPPPPGLAADAGSAAFVTWLDARAAEVKDLKSSSADDPHVKAFAAIPPARLVDLIANRKRYQANALMQYQIGEALPKLVRQEHRELVLANLETCPEFIATIVPHGWLTEATPIVRRMLATAALANKPKLTVEAVRMMAVVSQPSDFELLGQTFLRTRYGYWQRDIAHALATIPGFELDPLVRTAWQRPGPSAQHGDRDVLAIFAAKAGISEAMPIVVAHASGEKTGWSDEAVRKEAREYLAATFHVEPDKDAILDWWLTAKPLVHWDEAQRRWIGPAPAPVPVEKNAF